MREYEIEIEELEQNILKAREKHEMMKRFNSYYRKNKTLEGCPGIKSDSALEISQRISVKSGKPFSDETLRFSRKNINELEGKLCRFKAFRDAGDGWVFNGGRIEVDSQKRSIRLCDSSNETKQRLKELGAYFYGTAPDGTPDVMYFDHLIIELLDATRKYDELYPKNETRKSIPEI